MQKQSESKEKKAKGGHIPEKEIEAASADRVRAWIEEGLKRFDAPTSSRIQRRWSELCAAEDHQRADDDAPKPSAAGGGKRGADVLKIVLPPEAQTATLAMRKFARPAKGKDGDVIKDKDGNILTEYAKNDIAPLCAYLEARGVYRETFCTDNGLRLNGEELTRAALTREQMYIQAAGYPVMGTAGPKLMQQAAEFVGSCNERDGLTWFFDHELPEWDGTPRINTFFESYCGGNPSHSIAEHDYLAAVAKYMFTAIVGRAYATSSKPCKADYCITLVGESGCGKTSFCRALCVKPRFYKEVNTETPEDEWQRSLREVHIVEIGEIHETSDKHLQAMKRILSAETVKVRKKGVDENFFFPVRCFTFATADQVNVLNDPAGNRRFIPVNVKGFKRVSSGALCMDIKGIEAMKPQLYAEALVLWKENGVMWQGIPEDVRQAHAAEITQIDDRVMMCIEYMRSRNMVEASLAELWTDALGGLKDRFDKRAQMALSKEFQLSRRFKGPILRRFGKDVKRVWQLIDAPSEDGYDPDERF